MIKKESDSLQERVKATEEIYQRMVEEIEDYAILLLDLDGRIENWNKGAEKIKGYRAEEIIGSNFRIFYSRADLEAKRPDYLIEKALKEGKSQDEGWRIRKDGSTFWGSIVITAVHDKMNNVIGFAKVTRDLTERKLAEVELRRHTSQLEFQNKELEQFAYIASHDLQEPLRTISSFTELLDNNYKSQFDENGIMILKYIIDASERMRQQIRSLLDYSRIGKERKLEKVNCNKILDEVILDLNASIRETNAIIRADNLPTLPAFPTELKLLFQNLISNAIKFRKKDATPEISVTAKRKNDFWEFAVADNGIGIPERFLEKIFVIFQRLHSDKEYRGTGIGLAHCKKIVGLHSGDIWAESIAGKGSTFHFTIKSL